MFTTNEQPQKVNVAPLLARVAAALEERGVKVREVGPAPPDAPGDLNLDLTWRDRRRRYLTSVKSAPNVLSVATLRALAADDDLLLLARHIPSGVAEKCRRFGIHYADAAGNVFLDWGDLLLDVEGRRARAPAMQERVGRPLRAFQPSGLRVVFVLLCWPELRAAVYRDIAEASGTSVGTVHWVLSELIDHGYVEKRASKRLLHRTHVLFDRWVEAYTLSLEPRLLLGRYKTVDATAWLSASVPLHKYDALWGGESAASLLGRYVRPAAAVVYAAVVSSNMLRTYRLRKVPDGETVLIRKRFWKVNDGRKTVPTPLVYADLVASGDPRQIEAARRLRENDDDLRRLDAR